jgi:cysteine sulfinate desulfinase/cysteine desulfurase-like protein
MKNISLRFSFSKLNKKEEVDKVVIFLKDFINKN